MMCAYVATCRLHTNDNCLGDAGGLIEPGGRKLSGTEGSWAQWAGKTAKAIRCWIAAWE